MKSIKIIKLLSAIALVIAMFLPLSRCSHNAPPPKNEIIYEYNYSWSNMDYKEPSSFLPIIAFIWPVPILLYEFLGRRLWLKSLLSWVEPFLAAGSCYLLYLKTMFGELLFGGYLAYIALSAYFLISIINLSNNVYGWVKDKRKKEG